jgi:arginase
MKCVILGIPVQEGAGRKGCALGPNALRAAGLPRMLRKHGFDFADLGDVTPAPRRKIRHGNLAVKALPEVSAWTTAIAEAAYAASEDAVPIFIGGDHSLSAGTLSGLARRAQERDRPLFVLWLDAHADFHTLDTTESGNLHGVPLAYICGRPGFEGYFPALAPAVDPDRICLMGVRSVDRAEMSALDEAGITVHDMAAIDAHGIAPLTQAFLARVKEANGLLHVSLDVDFLDPVVAPAVGTAVERGVGRDDAHRVMEQLHASGLVTSLDLVELNPLLD